MPPQAHGQLAALRRAGKLAFAVAPLKSARPTARGSSRARSYGTSSSSAGGRRSGPGSVASSLSAVALACLAGYQLLLSPAAAVALDSEPARNQSSPQRRIVTTLEMREHSSRDSCWVAIEDPVSGKHQVWDVTGFLDQHPGGAASILTHGAGKDASKVFAPLHPKGVIERTLPPEALVGVLDQGSVKELSPSGTSDDERRVEQAKAGMPPLEAIINLDDFERVAQQVLSRAAWGYYACAGDDGYTQRENAYAYTRFWFRPRILRPVEAITMDTTLLGGRIKTSVPVYISPAARARMGHPEGERNLVKAASAGGIVHGVSCVASCSIEEMQEVRKAGDPWLFQIYLNRDRRVSEQLIKKVEGLGAAGIMFTVDLAVLGNRELDKRAKLADSGYGVGAVPPTDILRVDSRAADPDMTWDDVKWLKSITTLPVIVKGVQDVEDVALAAKHGADAVVLSNHGGRSLDFSPPPIDVLWELRQTKPELFSELEVWVDGGIRRGSDVLKALCLGAKAVGLGRPFLYANTYGQEGAEKAITIVKEEIATTMRLLGVKSLDELKPEMVRLVDREPAPLSGWRGAQQGGGGEA